MRLVMQVIVGLFILVVPMKTSIVYVYFQDEHPFQAGELVVKRNEEEEMYL